MIYMTDKDKYRHGERNEKKISLDVVKSQKHHLGAGAVYKLPLSEHYILILIVSGSIIMDGYRAGKGNIISVSRFTKFELTSCEPADIISVVFDYSDGIELFTERLRVIKAPSDIREWVKRIYDNNFFCNLLDGVNEGLLLNVLNMLNILCNSRTLELNLYQKCREWIEQNSGKCITAEEVAEAMSCGVAHLNRMVKKHSGKCLCTIISEERIFRIKQLADSSELSTKSIASKLDFGSAELLRKYFKYHTGISLKDYRTSAGI